MNENRSTLVTLLGGQPQVVTFLLDLLLARGEAIHQVVVVYLASNPRYQRAFRRLSGEFEAGHYSGRACQLRAVPIQSGAGQLDDIRDNHEVELARREIQRLLADLKAAGEHLHVGLSGGRRMMGFLMLSAAMQYLTPFDFVWHIYTPPGLAERARDGAVLHASSPGEVKLIQVPFVPWVSYFPGLSGLLGQSSQELGEARHYWLDHTERASCAQVWNALSRRQREVLAAFAAGHARQAVASRLSIEPGTVDDHREAIARECSKVWGFQENVRFDAHFLRERFGPFLEGLKQA